MSDLLTMLFQQQEKVKAVCELFITPPSICQHGAKIDANTMVTMLPIILKWSMP